MQLSKNLDLNNIPYEVQLQRVLSIHQQVIPKVQFNPKLSEHTYLKIDIIRKCPMYI